jgi:cytochrome b subunit of formate dehydrogenase
MPLAHTGIHYRAGVLVNYCPLDEVVMFWLIILLVIAIIIPAIVVASDVAYNSPIWRRRLSRLWLLLRAGIRVEFTIFGCEVETSLLYPVVPWETRH